MGTVTVWMQVSLDGYADGPNGEFDWPQVGPQLHGYFVEQLQDAAAFLYGRKVYEGMAAFWPTAEDDPSLTTFHHEYARLWKPMPKYVFSSSLGQADWNTSILADDVVGQVAELKVRTDGALVMLGGPSAAGQLVRAGLVDDYRLFVHPVLLGGGTRLIPPLDERAGLTLAQARSFDDAVVGLHYRR